VGVFENGAEIKLAVVGIEELRADLALGFSLRSGRIRFGSGSVVWEPHGGAKGAEREGENSTGECPIRR
jgi:hypothetical protein